MIAVDTNVLVHAHRAAAARHEAAKAHLKALAEAGAPWGIPSPCLSELLRIITHPRVFTPPYTPADACRAMERLFASPSMRLLVPASRHPELLAQAIREANATGNLVFDAQIVAICRENGVTALLTEDRDFGRFENFRTMRL